MVVREYDSRFILATFDCYQDYICFGSISGKIYLHSVSKDAYKLKGFEIARGGDGMIVNHIQFIPHPGYQNLDLMTACNDCKVKIYDLANMKEKQIF